MPSDVGAPSDELSDADLQQFVVSGFLQLPPSETPAAHAEIAKQIHACGLQDLNGAGRDPYGLRQLDGPAAGNNLLHAAPALRGPAFLESPKLMCALRRLLGPGYRVHPHCRGHLRQRSAKTSMWHVDAYKGLPWCSGRHHEPRWLMLMYYPQETTAEMGPTQLLPGSQYYRGDSDRHHYSRGHIPDFGEQLSGWATSIHTVTGPPGTIVIMHYDLWHRALASASDLPRLMLKFVVSRSSPPPASPVPPPRWPLVLYSTDDLELLAAEPLLDFLLAGGLEQGDGAAGGRPASAPKRRFDRQLEASSAAAAPSSEAVDVGDVAASDDAAGLATMLSSFLDANETEGAASHRSDLWSGLDLLNSKGAVEAEQRLFAAAVGLAKEALSTNKQRMPAVLSWLAPRCALAVKRAAGKERRVRFVMDRRPIWKHIWEWLHGYCKDDEEASETTTSEAQLLRSLRDELTSGTEPIRMRAAYDLAALPKGGDILVEVLSDIGDGMSTSVRRTAMYGCIAANRLHAQTFTDIMIRRLPLGTATLRAFEGREEAATEAERQDEQHERVDPVLGVPITDPSRWLSASLLREREGFDAECLLAASNKEAEAVYMAAVVLARNPEALDGSGMTAAQLLERFLMPTPVPLSLPPSARLVALESLAHPAIHTSTGVPALRLLAAILTNPLSHGWADAGTRAVAARALAHVAAQGLLRISDTLEAPCSDHGPMISQTFAAAEALAAAADRDPDRYVRGYAFEALMSATSTEQTEVRRSCAERWCPLTTPTSPF